MRRQPATRGCWSLCNLSAVIKPSTQFDRFKVFLLLKQFFVCLPTSFSVSMSSPSFRKFASRSGVDVIFDDGSDDRPHCKHGPTLLLTKKVGAKTRKYYACSAFRDNKCSLLKDSFDTKKIVVQRRKIRRKLIRILQAKKEERAYCRTCDSLFISKEYHQHQRHDVIDKIPLRLIKRPTLLLRASTKKEREAQYFFDDTTLDFIANTFRQLEFNRIICIGCPSIHEMIQSNKRTWNMESVLLDIDPRYCQFYLRKHFILFNMFNNFFFEGSEGSSKLDKFLRECQQGKTCLVIDPPFGGLIKALGRTIDKIHARFLQLHGHPGTTESTREILNHDSYQFGVMLFLPYFNENKIELFFKGLKMADYKVHYTNHKALRDCRCRSSVGSIVRIFTNIQPYIFALPEAEGYRLCEPCKRWVAKENKHCYKCNACTSKDGRESRHCNTCKKCFKMTWSHCNRCQRCRLPGSCECPVKKKVTFSKTSVISSPR